MAHIPTAIQFDMRAPTIGPPAPKLYQAALEMAAFADEVGVDMVGLMEHHGSDDGYLPRPFVLGGAVAGRTRRCQIYLGAVILPLHDPVAVAEEIAVLDLASGGRLSVVFGAGYVEAESAMFNTSLRDRGQRLDEGVDIILRALHGERFTAGGREIFVRPLPIQKPEDIILIGGGAKASARRAARFGLGFAPMAPDVFEAYEQACRELGREPGPMRGGPNPTMIHISEDPEGAWRKIMPHLRHTVVEYAKWAESGGGTDTPFRGLAENDEALRNSGFLGVMTPNEVVERAREIVGPYGSINLMPLIGGLDPEVGWESVRNLAAILPRLQA